MSFQTFTTRLKSLSLGEKFVLAGSYITIVSIFLPWYKDLDKFGTGDMFLGINGPLYLAGILVLIAAASSASILTLRLLDRPSPKIPLKESHWHISVGALSVLMLVLTSSVYFHNKFGINLTEKTMGIGMISAFIGVGFIIGGGVLSLKKRVARVSDLISDDIVDINERTQSHIEPVIETLSVVQEAGDIFKTND